MKPSTASGKSASNSHVPDWIHDRAKGYMDFYGLGQWRVHLMLEDNPGTDGTADGTCELSQVRYRQAMLSFRRARAEEGDNRNNRELVHHEVLHIALGLMHESVRTICEKMLFDDNRELAWDLFEQAQEATIEMLVRSLDPDIEELLEFRAKKAQRLALNKSHRSKKEVNKNVSDAP